MSEYVINFPAGYKPVIKFNPNHDDKGQFSSGSSIAGINPSAPFDTTLTAKDGTKVVVKTTETKQSGDMTFYSGTLNADGKQIGDWERIIGPNYVECTGLAIGEWGATDKSPYAGKGIGTEFHKHTELVAKTLGKENIVVHAVSDGSEVWANEKFGYKFDPLMSLPNFVNNIPGLYSPRMSYGKETWHHPFMENLQNREKVTSVLNRFLGSSNQYPTPSEILAIGKNGPTLKSIDPFRPGGYRDFTMGEYMLSHGWYGVKSSDHVTKMANVLKLHVISIEEMQKFNPNHDEKGQFATGNTGAVASFDEGNLSLNHFEKKVDKAYGKGDNAFTIAHTGDASTAALGTYLAKGHVLNDHIRSGQMDEYLTDETQVKDVVSGLDNAIEMAPRMPNQTVWRTTSLDAVKNLREGSIYKDKGFTSTTAADITHPDNGLLLITLSKVSHGQKAVMEIQTGKEGKGLYMPKMFPGQPIADFEKEFLLPRDTKMKYTGIDLRPLGNGDNWLQVHTFKVVN